MKRVRVAASAAALATLATLTACVTPIGPVEVTRFHDSASVQQLGHGTIAVEAAPGVDAASLELGTYRSAVARELTRIGYQTVGDGSGNQVALVRVERSTIEPDARSPIGVGVGGSTGSYGSGVGLGLSLDLSGKPKPLVVTKLGVMIKDRASGRTIWEGRAGFSVEEGAPLAQSALGAAKMAAALFAAFPGNNGETVEVQ